MSSSSTIKRRRRRKQCQHLCLDRAHSSKSIDNKIIKRGYVPHIPYKRKRGQNKNAVCQNKHSSSKKDGL
jgi:hypothetical protein